MSQLQSKRDTVLTYLYILFFLLSLIGCTSSFVQPLPPTATIPILPTVQPPPTPLTDTGWETISIGLERRRQNIFDADIRINHLYILRIDPAYYDFDIGYRPGQPQSLVHWQEETNADIVVNGGYYTEEFRATGLTIINGKATGWNYTFGGMVDIRAGKLRVRSLVEDPYRESEPIDNALQAFPLLIRPDNTPYYHDKEAYPTGDRRTVIAQDHAGKIILLIADMPQFTLAELSAWLVASDLDLDIVLNLDGGSSTGILLAQGTINEYISSFVSLPIVITAHRINPFSTP